ncbi:response regulator [Pseudoalteromonas sp. SMS1]|uniref:response regulator n=1 Tax=Pseudoalteromonas sp. SMS1 TaxID=2908894 RepID=UPI001F3AD058|nr:response regulator [Pseudoalteromonas sp. SMS1]MCF2855840.1 response regulator [Pseudoalteromonas sp. SMS1]
MIEKEVKILIIDDDKLMLRALSKAVTRVLSVSEIVTLNDPLLVETYLSEDNANFDLIISDYQMPNLNGKEVLTIARHLSPKSVRILMSGDVGDISFSGQDIPTNHLMEKPFNKDELVLLKELMKRGQKVVLSEEESVNFGLLPYFPTPSYEIYSALNDITNANDPQLKLQLDKARDILTNENQSYHANLSCDMMHCVAIAYYLSLELIHIVGITRQNDALTSYLTWSSQAYSVASSKGLSKEICENIFMTVFIGYIHFLIKEYFLVKSANDKVFELNLSDKFLLMWGISEHLINERNRIQTQSSSCIQDTITQLFLALSPNVKTLTLSSLIRAQSKTPHLNVIVKEMKAKNLVLEEVQ